MLHKTRKKDIQYGYSKWKKCILWNVRSSCYNYMPPWFQHVYACISFTICQVQVVDQCPRRTETYLWASRWSLVGDCVLVIIVNCITAILWCLWLALVMSNHPTAARSLLMYLCEVYCCNESSILAIISYRVGCVLQACSSCIYHFVFLLTPGR